MRGIFPNSVFPCRREMVDPKVNVFIVILSFKAEKL